MIYKIQIQMFDKTWRTIDATDDKSKAKTLRKYHQHFFGRKERIRTLKEVR